METLKTSETLIEGLVTSEQDETRNPVGQMFPEVLNSFDFGENNAAGPVAAPPTETGGIVAGNFELPAMASVTEIDRGLDSGSHVDLPTKGISLFVKLTGNRTDSENTRDVNSESMHENRSGIHEHWLNVGDFVWAIFKNQTWWPGLVSDASNAPKEVEKREDGILVQYFGNGNHVWRHPSQLRPFVPYFEQLSKQNRSKSFVGAVDKAVAEFGFRVKTEFTCSCFSNTVVESRADFDRLSMARFDPVTFVDYIRNLAIDIGTSSKIDNVVNQNCLSAFYRSLGRCQIPMHQLKPGNNAKTELSSGDLSKMKTEEENGIFDEDTVMNTPIDGKLEKAYETRERRKSRFLSYPYTNLNPGPKGENRVEESKTDFNGGSELNVTNIQPVKKPRKKWTKRTVVKNDKGAELSVCSSEVLSELRFAALDCVFPRESAGFAPIERFISRFRKWAFNDIANEITMLDHQILPETGGQSENQIGAGMVAQVQPVVPKKVRKKKGKSVISPENNVNRGGTGAMIIDFQNLGFPSLEAQQAANKKTEAAPDEAVRDTKAFEPVSDLTGNCTVFNFGGPPVAEPLPSKPAPKRRKKKAEPDASMQAWSNNNVTGFPIINGHMNPFLVQTVPQTNHIATAFHLLGEAVSAPPCFTGNNSELPAGLNFPAKKRGRKRKTMEFPANSPVNFPPNTPANFPPNTPANFPVNFPANGGSAGIPDLNSDGAEKKKGKRIKRKEETGVPCIDLNYNKVQPDSGEVSGTAFLLKFSPDHPLPTKEDLNSVFSKYGALNEPETQVLTEIRSGQVVFLDSSSAGGAFWGLQKDQPFGPALVNYRVQHLSGGGSTGGFKTPIKMPLSGLNPSPDPLAITASTMIPDLNGNLAEHKLMKRSKSKEEVRLPLMNQDSGEPTGIALTLKFSPDHPLPSNQDLNSVFCKYGPLNEPETLVSGQTLSGQVVFVNPWTAGEAVRGLEKDRPFGPGLVSYRVQHLYSGQPVIPLTSPVKSPIGPIKGKSDGPDLAIIRKNLEMMTSMLERAGNSLSPEMRAKLEGEINGLMSKVTAMDGPSSSSCL